MDSPLFASESLFTDTALTNDPNSTSRSGVCVCVCVFLPIPPINQILILPGEINSITSLRLRIQSHETVLLGALPTPSSEASVPVILSDGLWLKVPAAPPSVPVIC